MSMATRTESTPDPSTAPSPENPLRGTPVVDGMPASLQVFDVSYNNFNGSQC